MARCQHGIARATVSIQEQILSPKWDIQKNRPKTRVLQDDRIYDVGGRDDEMVPPIEYAQ